jgi:hypothetical protein
MAHSNWPEIPPLLPRWLPRHGRTLYAFLLALLLCGGAARLASGTTLMVSESGTFTAGTPVTLETAPGDSWNYSFELDSNPTVYDVDPGYAFATTVSDFQFTLNGVSVNELPYVKWQTADWGGLFLLAFSNPDGDVVIFCPNGDQAYSGPESSPTILPGAYTLNTTTEPSVVDFFDSSSTHYDVEPFSGTVYITATPEPSTALLLFTGLAAGLLAGIRRMAA